MVEKTLGCAEPIGTLPSEASHILRVDHHRQRFPAVLNAFPIFRGKTPHLATGDGKTAVESSLRPELALPENVAVALTIVGGRSEEHTSELQSLTNLVCRLLLEKK